MPTTPELEKAAAKEIREAIEGIRIYHAGRRSIVAFPSPRGKNPSFEAFARDRFAHENTDFLNAVRQLLKLEGDRLKAAMNELVEVYISREGPSSINLAGEVRDKFISEYNDLAISDDVSLNSVKEYLVEAVKEVAIFVSRNIGPDFIVASLKEEKDDSRFSMMETNLARLESAVEKLNAKYNSSATKKTPQEDLQNLPNKVKKVLGLDIADRVTKLNALVRAIRGAFELPLQRQISKLEAMEKEAQAIIDELNTMQKIHMLPSSSLIFSKPRASISVSTSQSASTDDELLPAINETYSSDSESSRSSTPPPPDNRKK